VAIGILTDWEMDLVALRSQLSSLFDDLRNLAFSDLKECNWKTQKMVVTYTVLESFVNCNNLISWTGLFSHHYFIKAPGSILRKAI
jgi:hypothetical protein